MPIRAAWRRRGVALRDEEDVAIAAAQVLRALLDARESGVAREALDALVTVALDAAAPRSVRLAAFDMLRDLPEDVRRGRGGRAGAGGGVGAGTGAA